MNQNLRLPCAFIDLKKAFDSVNTDALWYKLFHMGMNGKLLKRFRSMYASVKSCIKYSNRYSEFFDISIGLRQGQTSSPAFFALFLEDLEMFLQNEQDCSFTIRDICIIILLFADDMVLIGNSREDLQHSLIRLHEYCERWGLEVNIDKRKKKVVFRKRGKIKATDKWYFKNSETEVVDNYNYLGVILNYTGSFNLNNQYLNGNDLKALHILSNNVLKYQVN